MDIILTVSSWRNLRLNGVLAVINFDEEYVSLETETGRINIEGSDLRIEALSKEKSDIEIVGNITGVFNVGVKKSTNGKKLFK